MSKSNFEWRPARRRRGFFLVEAIIAIAVVSICSMIISELTFTGRATAAASASLAINLLHARTMATEVRFEFAHTKRTEQEISSPLCSSSDERACPTIFRSFRQQFLVVGVRPAIVSLVKWEKKTP